MRHCSLLLIAAGLLGQQLFAQDVENTRAKPTDWEEVNFETNSAVLVDGFPSLLRLADLLKAHPDYKVTIVGNADQRGSTRANDALSVRRANAVAQFLEKYGATAGQVTARGDGKRNLEENARNRNAMFINRRVTINVTAPDGTVIGDGSISSAILDFITYARGQLGKVDTILSQLQQLEAQVRALNTADIKQDTGQIRQDTGQIRQDTNQIRQDSGQIRRDTGTLVQRPVPLTADQTTQIAHDAADYALKQSAMRNRKYSLLGFDVGPTFAPARVGDFAADVFGRALIPFGNGKTPEESGTHGFVVDGSWAYGHSNMRRTDVVQLYSSSDAIFNTGLVNRFGHAQIGTFAQFDYASLGLNQLVTGAPVATTAFTRGGTLLAGGVVTFDWVFKGFTAGFFGAKGIKDTGNITTTSLTAVTTPAFLRFDDQAGLSFQGTFRKFQIEGSGAWVKRNIRGLDEQPAGMLKVSFGPTDTMQFYIEGDVNPTFNGFNYGDRVVFGLQFGNWVRARNYGNTQSVVPVVIPRPHYELLTR
jgi:hypothetical protein